MVSRMVAPTTTNETMSKKEFFWGVVVVIAGLLAARYVTPIVDGLLARVGLGGTEPSA